MRMKFQHFQFKKLIWTIEIYLKNLCMCTQRNQERAE